MSVERPREDRMLSPESLSCIFHGVAAFLKVACFFASLSASSGERTLATSSSACCLLIPGSSCFCFCNFLLSPSLKLFEFS